MNGNCGRGTSIHRRQAAFTLIELLVVVAVIATLIAILLPSLSQAKEEAKQSVCVSKHRQLMLAWMMYADERGGFLVNGGTGVEGQPFGPPLPGENGWVGWSGTTHFPPIQTIEEQIHDIKVGELFKYVGGATEIYKCPTTIPETMRTYAIVDAMNGWPWLGQGVFNPRIIKMLSRIERPAERMVFFDDGQQTYASWTSFVHLEAWMEPPSSRHGKGATYSFADGHAEYFKWTHDNTRKVGAMTLQEYLDTYGNWSAPSGYCNEDLFRIQKACWGRLEYTPGCWEE